METTTKFEVGKSYYAPCFTDHTMHFELPVVSRTAKTLKTAHGKTLRIFNSNGVETVVGFSSADTTRPLREG
jgi:hypothetical protein